MCVCVCADNLQITGDVNFPSQVKYTKGDCSIGQVRHAVSMCRDAIWQLPLNTQPCMLCGALTCCTQALLLPLTHCATSDKQRSLFLRVALPECLCMLLH